MLGAAKMLVNGTRSANERHSDVERAYRKSEVLIQISGNPTYRDFGFQLLLFDEQFD
jgi:hypothetical protein